MNTFDYFFKVMLDAIVSMKLTEPLFIKNAVGVFFNSGLSGSISPLFTKEKKPIY